jgi:hypothetical protein
LAPGWAIAEALRIDTTTQTRSRVVDTSIAGLLGRE